MPVSTGAHRLNSTSVFNPVPSISKILDFRIPNLNLLKKIINLKDKNEKKALGYGYAIAYSRLFLYYSDSMSLINMAKSYIKLLRYDILTLKPLTPVTTYRLAKRIAKRIIH
jgi:hypothetical protein